MRHKRAAGSKSKGDTKIKQKVNHIIIEGVKDFSLRHILECGQCFRWEKESDASYTVTAGGRVANLKEKPSQSGQEGAVDIEIENYDQNDGEDFWGRYLDLNRNYGEIKKTLLQKDPSLHMKEAVAYGAGMRILRQDPWETVISFIISQNNNIKRIQKCIEQLCGQYGPSLGAYRGKARFGFPSADTLAALCAEDLADCRLGYRAAYILSTARKVASEGEIRLKEAGEGDFKVMMDYLQSLSGVGPKVANCVALFAFGRFESFPIDVWVRKAMSLLYGLDEKDLSAMAAFASQAYGDMGGFAQQYLFYHMRERKERKPSC